MAIKFNLGRGNEGNDEMLMFGLLCLWQCFFELGFGLFHLNDKKVNKKQEHNVNIGWLLSVPNLYILTTICAVG